MTERSLDELLGVRREHDELWEVFHENSKNVRAVQSSNGRSPQEIQDEMRHFHESLPYAGYQPIRLPAPRSLDMPLERAIVARQSTRQLAPSSLALDEVAALLHYSYGMLRENEFVAFPPRTRAVASAGALYPLELYFHVSRVVGLSEGLYHYSVRENCVQRLGPLYIEQLCRATTYPDMVRGASLTLFVTALFERSTWKYGARGYRYALMEAGEVAHSAGLVAAALNLGSFNLGGFLDREVDELLELDGVTHSTLHLVCFGGLPTAGGAPPAA